MGEVADVLVVVAHPDDETLFFGGAIDARPRGTTDLVVVTDGGFLGEAPRRRAALARAAEALGIRRVFTLEHPDTPSLHLPVDEIRVALTALHGRHRYREVWTHNPHGEYGHLAHADVSLATLRAFSGRVDVEVFVVADLLPARRVVSLSPEAHARKLERLATFYAEDLPTIVGTVPLGPGEAMTQVSLAEAELVYRLVAGYDLPAAAVLDATLQTYAGLRPMLAAIAARAHPSFAR